MTGTVRGEMKKNYRHHIVFSTVKTWNTVVCFHNACEKSYTIAGIPKIIIIRYPYLDLRYSYCYGRAESWHERSE